MVTASIVLLYVSYAVPVVALLVRGRSHIRHGPFWLGPFGAFANYVLIGWTLFTITMYSFPYYYPATAHSKSNPRPLFRWYMCVYIYISFRKTNPLSIASSPHPVTCHKPAACFSPSSFFNQSPKSLTL